MWLLLGSIWVNTDHLVRVEFVDQPKLTATVISTKPGGSDRTIFYDEDARKLKEYLEGSNVPPPAPRKRKTG